MRVRIPALDERMLRQVRWGAPLLSAALLAGMIAFGTVTVRPPEGLEAYQARVRLSVEEIPIRIGGWLGEPVEATPAAQKLLKPNVISQRRYVELDGTRSISVLIVHCGNVRDMYGHYPRVCYPNSGWTLDGTAERTIELEDREIPALDYRFSREHQSETQRLRVVSFFVLPNPDKPLYRYIDAVSTASRSPRAAGLGSGQVQLVINDNIDGAGWDAVIDRFVSELLPAIDEMGRGPDGP